MATESVPQDFLQALQPGARLKAIYQDLTTSTQIGRLGPQEQSIPNGEVIVGEIDSSQIELRPEQAYACMGCLFSNRNERQPTCNVPMRLSGLQAVTVSNPDQQETIRVDGSHTPPAFLTALVRGLSIPAKCDKAGYEVTLSPESTYRKEVRGGRVYEINPRTGLQWDPFAQS